jgi:hypothetical protein
MPTTTVCPKQGVKARIVGAFAQAKKAEAPRAAPTHYDLPVDARTIVGKLMVRHAARRTWRAPSGGAGPRR